MASTMLEKYSIKQKALSGLKRGLGDALKSGSYSDVKISLSDGNEWQCHRLILCSQCEFFRNALKPGTFKESATGVIEMVDDPPKAIEALLEFLYTANYTLDYFGDDASRSEHTSETFARQIEGHMHVYVAAIKYDIGTLQELSCRRVLRDLDIHFADVTPVFLRVTELLRDAVPLAQGAAMRTGLEDVAVKHMGTMIRDRLFHDFMVESPDHALAALEKFYRKKCTQKLRCTCNGIIEVDVPVRNSRVLCMRCGDAARPQNLKLHVEDDEDDEYHLDSDSASTVA